MSTFYPINFNPIFYSFLKQKARITSSVVYKFEQNLLFIKVRNLLWTNLPSRKIKLPKNNYRRQQVKGQVTSPAVQIPTERYWMSNHGLKRLEVLAFSHHFFHFCHKGFCAYPRYIHLQSGQNVLQLDIPNTVLVLSMKCVLYTINYKIMYVFNK